MKRNRKVHRLFVAMSLLLGLFATGISAKANSVQPNQVNVNTNHNSNTNYTNQNQVQNYNAQLVNNDQQNNGYRTVDNHVSNAVPSSSHSVQPQLNQAGNFNQTKNAYSNRYINNYSRYLNQRTVWLHNRIINSGIHRIHSQEKKKCPVRILKVYRGQARAHLLRSHLYYHYMRLANLRRNRIHYYKARPVGRVKNSYPHVHHQVNYMNHPHSMNRSVKHQGMFYQRWFRDGLSRRNYRARRWVSWHESNHRWNILSYGGVCVGYFQLNPHYLGYRHGHVDLRKRHQVKVADHYVASRYGNWLNAKAFWEVHHWY